MRSGITIAIFTNYPSDKPKILRSEQFSETIGGWHQAHSELYTLGQSLWNLACLFKCSEGNQGITEFIKAYVHGGMVVNSENLMRTPEEDIHSGLFLEINCSSNRSATLPRDYLFATHSQFPWYHFPEQAIKMTFGELYFDLYEQAATAGHAFTTRFLRSMIEGTSSSPTEDWLPSKYQPSPACLGDFLKLMGRRIPERSSLTSEHVRLTSMVLVQEHGSSDPANGILAMIKKSMRKFARQWTESASGGELIKCGTFPDSTWTLDPADAIRRGWQAETLDHETWIFKTPNGLILARGSRVCYTEIDLPQDLHNLEKFDVEDQHTSSSSYVPLLKHSQNILAYMWMWGAEVVSPHPMTSRWNEFLGEMQGNWPMPLLRTMLLMVAMITCGIPLSAAAWVNQLFVPAFVQYGNSEKGFHVLGLLSKHARQDKLTRCSPQLMLSVGQHSDDYLGCDLFLVDIESEAPVGLLPDFLPVDFRTEEDALPVPREVYWGLVMNDPLKVAGIPLSQVKPSWSKSSRSLV